MGNEASAIDAQALLEKAKADPSKIGVMLKENFAKADLAESVSLLLPLIFGSVSPEGIIGEITHLPVSSGICGRIINNYDLMWFCKNCALTESSGVCHDCYTNSDHKGHNCGFKKGMIGVCDCGDPDAWAVSGFCKNHKGFDEKAIRVELLPPYVRVASQKIIGFLMKSLNRAALEAEGMPEKRNKLNVLVIESMQFLDQLSGISPIFSKLICMNLNRFCFEPIEDSMKHKCNFRTFISDGEQSESDLKLNKKQAKKHCVRCKCKVLENMIKVFHYLNFDALTIFVEYLVKMAKSPLLKDLLGFGLIANYDPLITQAEQKRLHAEQALEKLNLQVFTIDELGKKYLANPLCQASVVNLFHQVISQVIGPPAKYPGQDLTLRAFFLKREIRYFLQSKTTEFLLTQTDVFQRLLQEIAQTEFIPILTPLKEHIADENSIVTPYRLKIDSLLFTICKWFLLNIDYGDLTTCKKFASFFVTLLKSQTKLRKELFAKAGPGARTFAILLHRLFSIFLNLYLNVRARLEGKKEHGINWKETNIIEQRKIIRGWLQEILCVPGLVEGEAGFNAFVEEILETVWGVIMFVIESGVGKWVLYGDIPRQIRAVYFGALKGCLYKPDFYLIQLLTSISEHSSSFFMKICSSKSMDESKVGQELEELFYFICQLCMNGTIETSGFARLAFPLPVANKYLVQVKPEAELALKVVLRNELINYSMYCPLTQFQYHSFSSTLSKRLRALPALGDLVHELCVSYKGAKGSLEFSLKPEKAKFFDPYTYSNASESAKAVVLALELEKKLGPSAEMDLVLGRAPSDTAANLAGFSVNRMFASWISENAETLEGVVKTALAGNSPMIKDFQKVCAYKILYCALSESVALPKASEVITLSLTPLKAQLLEELASRMQENPKNAASYTKLALLLQQHNIVLPDSILKLLMKSPTSDSSKVAPVTQPEDKLKKEKQMKILEEFKAKQKKFMFSNLTQIEEIKKDSGHGKGEEICVACQEKVSPENFQKAIYGKFVYVEGTYLVT